MIRNPKAVLVSLAVLIVALMLASGAAAPAAKNNATANNSNASVGDAKSGDAATFTALVPVLRHPRCLNCHSTGDYPRQGDDGHPHAMNVRRGAGGMGVTSQKCVTCHQDHNLAGAHLPPGAPNWRLPSARTPMIWRDRSDKEVCEELKDPKQNGGRSLQKIVEHMTADKLVLWGWSPGEGRSPVSMPQAEFAAKVKAWAAAGAPCPAR
ncbi:MAG TPA: Isoquinoline 1-oxidoreductase subunit [Candidatus Angelobacter sp.]|nr:Isoquinoline 1-oxidoreductase subunit [Candidatus Angelobacter sp.]